MQLTPNIDEVIARGTFHSMLKAVRAAIGALGQDAAPKPALIVITEAGQTNVYDAEGAVKLADTFARDVGLSACVVQIVHFAAAKVADGPAEGEKE